jgi:hypothetical protein
VTWITRFQHHHLLQTKLFILVSSYYFLPYVPQAIPAPTSDMPRHPNTFYLTPHVKMAVAPIGQSAANFQEAALLPLLEASDCTTTPFSKVGRQRCDALLEDQQARPPPPRHLTDGKVIGRVRAAPLCQRQSLRSLSAATNIPKTTLMRYLKRSVIRRKVSRVRPTLLATHGVRRLT